jgi:hypothetical protein
MEDVMSIGSSDLGYALWMVGGFLLVVAAIAAVVAWTARRRGSRTAVISATLTIAGWWVALIVIATPFAVVQTLTADSVMVTDLPVSMAWPEPLDCGASSAATPTLACANVPTANATILGLTFAPRALLAVGQVLGSVAIALPAVAIGVVCFQMLRGRPFARTASRALIIAALVVLVAGIGVDIASGIGRGLAAAEVLPRHGDGAVTAGAVYSLTVELWPFGAALALAALAAVFRYGFTLQRETEGLV